MDKRVSAPPNPRKLAHATRIAAVWSFGYGLYRLYYARGGTCGMFGMPAALTQWHRLNGIAEILLFTSALLPLVMMTVGWIARLRRARIGICWVLAVAGVSQA